MSVTQAFLEQAYLAYFGRPIDPNGAVWYARPSVTEEQVIEEFSHSPESQALYGTSYDLAFVNSIYQNLFNRDADITGGTWWVNELLSGRVKPAEAALAILNGAQPGSQDGIVIQNKLLASHAFTANLDTVAEITGFAGTPALDSSRVFLHSVTSTPATPAQVSAAITTAIGAGHLSVDSPSVLEGGVGVNNQLVFTLTLSAAQTTDTVISYATQSNGTALPDVDFVAAVGTVTIPAFQTTATVSVTIIGDAVIQPDQTVNVQFSSDAVLASVTATGTIVNDDVPVVPPVLPETFVLTTGQDTFIGNSDDDAFLATQATLQLGDVLDGAGGDDILDVSISGSGIALQGFTADNIETIRVKSISSDASTLDLSDTTGVVELVSDETDGASLTFRDIQNVNETEIKIIDTKEDHTYIYDTNAYAPNGGQDTVELTLSEIRDSNGSEDSQGVDVVFMNRNGSPSDVDNVILHSVVNADAGPTPAVSNYVQSLQVGSKFTNLVIDNGVGNDVGANLEIEEALDNRVATINAAALNANLTLDVVTATNVGLFSYTGAQQVDNLDVTRNGNNNIALNNGNDDLTVIGDGNQTISAGADHDRVRLTGDGESNIDLGTGNDALAINGRVDDYNTTVVGDGVTTIVAGSGNDTVTIMGDTVAPQQQERIMSPARVAGDYNIDLGEGNDSLSITGAGNQLVHAGAGNDTVSITGNGSNVIYGEADNDGITIVGNGHQFVDAGAGNDTVRIEGDGDQTVIAAAGNDSVIIDGDGVHYVDLGEDNDYLLIDGARTGEGNADNALNYEPTIIIGGTGNDTVVVTADHYLDADLGSGNDSIELNTKDQSADDVIQGGSGVDTLIFQNNDDSVIEGRVLRSETVATNGFEVYDLRDSNITLALTDHMIESAEGHNLTVSTALADHKTLPTLTLVASGAEVVVLHQGMTNADFTALATGVVAGLYVLPWSADYSDLSNSAAIAAAKQDLVEWLLGKDFKVNFADTTGDGDNALFVPGDSEIELPDSERADTLWFFFEQEGAQTVDITSITTPDYHFTLNGGNVRDIVIADDDSINGRMVLNFNSATGDALSAQDTLQVIGGAEITAADLRNVQGLERIELLANGLTAPQTWGIGLTDIVINQTTGSADLVIDVSSNVPAGSKLYITLDPSVTAATNNVVIQKNANVQVYINDHLVSEPELGNDWNPGLATIKVVNQLVFTTNGDHLISPEGNDHIPRDDLFIANDLQHIHGAGDTADGLGNARDGDTLQLNFAVANATQSLDDIFGGADIQNIEHIVFNTENNVIFDGLGGLDPALRTLKTGLGDDTLTDMRVGISYNLNEGNDALQIEGRDGSTTVDGGAGQDTVSTTRGTNDTIVIDNVEFVIDGDATQTNWFNWGDSVTLKTNRSQSAYTSAGVGLITLRNIETVTGSDIDTILGFTGNDYVSADSNGGDVSINGVSGNDTLIVGNDSVLAGIPDDVTALGGIGNDSITVYSSGDALVYGDDNNTVTADGNDTIWVQAGDDASVAGEGGDDSLTVSATDDATVSGGSGNDSISVTAGDDATVSGGAGNDTVVVNAGDQASVNGDSGNDSITVEARTARVDGGTDDDVIVVHNHSGQALTVTVWGGDGSDSITVLSTNTGGSGSVDGGLGNDTISTDLNNSYSVYGGSDNYDRVNKTGGDLITLGFHHATGTGDHSDTVYFADLTYNAAQVMTDYQGFDFIKDFVFEGSGGDPNPPTQDYLNVDAFLGTVSGLNKVTVGGTWAPGQTVVASNANSDSVVVLSTNGATLSAANFSAGGVLGFGGEAGTIILRDNHKSVVVVGTDQTGSGSGIDNFDVYYVQDVDSTTSGQTWKVDLVGHIDSATLVGIGSVMDNIIA